MHDDSGIADGPDLEQRVVALETRLDQVIERLLRMVGREEKAILAHDDTRIRIERIEERLRRVAVGVPAVGIKAPQTIPTEIASDEL